MLLEGLGPGAAPPAPFDVPVPALGTPAAAGGGAVKAAPAGASLRGSGGGGVPVLGSSPTGRRGPLLPPAVEEEGPEATGAS